jgi:hypothetical protein
LRRSLRITATVVVAALAATTGATTAGAAVDVKGNKGPKIKLNDACTILSTKQVVKAFGGPAKPKVPLVGGQDCNYPVGVDPNTPPGGTLATEQLFPNLLAPVSDAQAAVEDTHAIDTLSKDNLADVNHLGLEAYINYTKGVLLVAARKKYAFSISWHPASVTHGTITVAEGRKLIKLAKDIVKRAPK